MPKLLNQQFVQRSKFCSQILGILVSLIGLAALSGWQFDIVLLKRILPTLPVIAPNTALAFLVGGLTLIFQTSAATKNKKFFLYISGLFSSYIILVGFMTLVEYLFNQNLGIDRILFSIAQGETTVRMSPQSAFNFLMLGLSLFFIIEKQRDKVKVAQVIILLAGAVSLVSLFGFIYSISSFYTIAPYKGMAAHTAVAFVMMFFGTLLAYPEYGFMHIFSSRNPSGVAARRLFAMLLFIISMEIFAVMGRRQNIISFDVESVFHLLLITAVFVYLIFFAFRSLDELGKMEQILAKSRELDRAKTEFVGLASHQLRTPLTAVSWYTEMLLGKDLGNLNEKQADYLGEIYAGNQRMIDLVDDLLNTSRIDMGTLKIKPEPVDLAQAMEGTLDEFSPQIIQKKIDIEKKFSRNLPILKLDPELLKIVFQNIISNAVKYIQPKGKIAVEMRRQNSHVLIKVADNGWGIPAQQQNRIFTKMFRADNVRQRDMEGTGLGLYIARAIVRKFGGKIWFDSKENKGSVFYITLKA